MLLKCFCLENDLQEWFVIDFAQTRWIGPKKSSLAMERLLTDNHKKTSSQTAARDWMGIGWKINQTGWDRLFGQNVATLVKGLLGVVDIVVEG